MATYYVNLIDGNDFNDGLTEQSSVKNYRLLDIRPGDKVLFKRGTFIRDKLHVVEGTENQPVLYGAYGEGEMPTFCGSVDLSDHSAWKKEERNIWFCNLDVTDEAANLVFDNNMYGILRWTKQELSQQGDFYDNCFGFTEKGKQLSDNHKIYLYSTDNPANIYSSIECVVYGKRRLADVGHDIIYQGLRFMNSGVHGIAGEGKSKNLKVIGCHFKNIGGAVWDYEKKIRFGNAVEIWNTGENIEIAGCLFDNIYDSATTHQGGDACEPVNGFVIRDNVFMKCGMAAYEQRDVMPRHVDFINNICVDAGEGFSKLGAIMPRYSEIWPEPMGHHIFLWRIEKTHNDVCFEIKGNIFYNSPHGAAIYSIISKEAESKIKLSDNTYYTSGRLIARWNGRLFEDFSLFSQFDTNGQYCENGVDEKLSEWETENKMLKENFYDYENRRTILHNS